MAHTVELLSLIEDYPDAFLEPTEAPLTQPSTASTADSSKNESLIALMSEFPDAFIEPDEPQSSEPTVQSSEKVIENLEAPIAAVMQRESAIQAPPGYELAFHQDITTYGWGTVHVHLRYDSERLTSLWITVGKSGTEVQSFCEAIARLTNRLLAVGTPIPELVKELRGIRGGDSEGFGPHRFLGLVDLFGKVLQDAPATMVTQTAIPTAAKTAEQTDTESSSLAVVAPANVVAPVKEDVQETIVVSTENHQWVALSDTSAIASICPECGAELQQVNGCSGGACVVCGYSSCS